MGANRTVYNLVDIVGGFRLSEYLGTLVVLEFAEDYACSRQLTELSQGLRSAAGMGVDVDKHGLPLFETICLHLWGLALPWDLKMHG